MKHNTLYLAGQITPDPATYKWRDEVVSALGDVPKLDIINPCNSEFDRALTGQPKDEHGYNPGQLKDIGYGLLPFKDLDHVAKSTVIFFNLWQFDAARPLMGTIFEMAWAFERPNIMKIGILRNHLDTQIGKHPFVQQTITAWVGHHMEAVDLLRRYID